MPLQITETNRAGELWGNAFANVGASMWARHNRNVEETKRIKSAISGSNAFAQALGLSEEEKAQYDAIKNDPTKTDMEKANLLPNFIKGAQAKRDEMAAQEKAKNDAITAQYQQALANRINAETQSDAANQNAFRQAAQPVQAPGYGVKSMNMPMRQKTPEEMFGAYAQAGGNNPAMINSIAQMAEATARSKGKNQFMPQVVQLEVPGGGTVNALTTSTGGAQLIPQQGNQRLPVSLQETAQINKWFTDIAGEDEGKAQAAHQELKAFASRMPDSMSMGRDQLLEQAEELMAKRGAKPGSGSPKEAGKLPPGWKLN